MGVGGEMGDPFLTPNKSRDRVRAGRGEVLKKISGTLELIFFRSKEGGKPGTFFFVHNRDLSILRYKNACQSKPNLAIILFVGLN